MLRTMHLISLSMLVICHGFKSASRWGLINRQHSSVARVNMASDGVKVAIPGIPVVTKLDKEQCVAYLSIALSGDQTQTAFSKSCEIFNEEVKNKGYQVPGFRPGAKLPPTYLYQMFGEDQVKGLCCKLMTGEIQDECEKTGLMFVGRGRVLSFNEAAFSPGQPHIVQLECDLWPEIKYDSSNGYKGLVVTAVRGGAEVEAEAQKYEKVRESIMQKYKELRATAPEYEARVGDVVRANMRGFERAPGGGKGAPLPAVASGDAVEIYLEEGKFMEGMVEGLIGARAGQVKDINVKFPVRSGAGAALSGKDAVFEVEVLEVRNKVMPEWNEELAGRIREGLTLKDLETEVRTAIAGDRDSQSDAARNEAIANELIKITTFSKLPESLIEESTQEKFQNMLEDFKAQGSSPEDLREMGTLENYERYKTISRTNIEKMVKLGMIFRDIAEKEKLEVADAEVKEQLDVLAAQARQKGEPLPDQRLARDEIENVLLRKKVFDFLASSATVNWMEKPESSQPPQ